MSHYSPPAVTLGGYVVLGVTSATSGLAWVAGQVVELPPAAAEAASRAGPASLYMFAGTLSAILVNGWIADRKSTRETRARDAKDARESRERVELSDQRVAERVAAALLVSERKLIEAKAEADIRVAAFESRLASAETAKAEADSRVTAVEARFAVADRSTEDARARRHQQLDGLGQLINELRVHAESNTEAINALIPAVGSNAARLGVEPPAVAPVASVYAEPPATRLHPRA